MNMTKESDENGFPGLKLKPSFEPSEEVCKIFTFEQIIGT